MSDPQWRAPGYTELRELGSGGGGTVWEALSASGEPVAVKYLGPDLLADQAFRAAFRAEARLLCALDSPHVVGLHEYVECAAGAAIVMELVDGPSLRAVLADRGPVEPQAALVLLKGALLGLAAAHAAGVVHRDVKPGNVLVGSDGTSRLADFGVAARSGGATDGSGTPAYMPPEQWQGGRASPSGDVYAATATFVECLTGRPPYPATDLATLREQHLRAAVPTGSLPEPVRGLALHGLAKHPADRPPDAAAFLDELERAAVEGYGERWEERGRASLARRAVLLLLVRSAAPSASTAIGTTILGGAARRLPAALLSGAVVAAIAVGVFMVGEPQVTPLTTPTGAVEDASGLAGTVATVGDGGPDSGPDSGSDGADTGSAAPSHAVPPVGPTRGSRGSGGPTGGPEAGGSPDGGDGTDRPRDGRPPNADNPAPGNPNTGNPGGRPDGRNPDGRPDDRNPEGRNPDRDNPDRDNRPTRPPTAPPSTSPSEAPTASPPTGEPGPGTLPPGCVLDPIYGVLCPPG